MRKYRVFKLQNLKNKSQYLNRDTKEWADFEHSSSFFWFTSGKAAKEAQKAPANDLATDHGIGHIWVVVGEVILHQGHVEDYSCPKPYYSTE